MERVFGIWTVCIAVVILAACTQDNNPIDQPGSPVEQIQDEEVRNVVRRAVDAAGGWEAWLAIARIVYTKRSVLYHPDGAIESDMSQLHEYELKPQLSGEISWTDNQVARSITYSDTAAYQTENGTRIADSELSAQQAFLSAYYVLFIPFKLLDPGTLLTYEGLDTLESGTAVDIIKAAYDPGEHHNHSTQDTWWYFFDRNDGAHVGSMVHHPPTYALIENKEITDDHMIRFNTYRESFRCDSLRNKEYLRGVFYYSDYRLN